MRRHRIELKKENLDFLKSRVLRKKNFLVKNWFEINPPTFRVSPL
jgi:hypothetical protein